MHPQALLARKRSGVDGAAGHGGGPSSNEDALVGIASWPIWVNPGSRRRCLVGISGDVTVRGADLARR